MQDWSQGDPHQDDHHNDHDHDDHDHDDDPDDDYDDEDCQKKGGKAGPAENRVRPLPLPHTPGGWTKSSLLMCVVSPIFNQRSTNIKQYSPLPSHRPAINPGGVQHAHVRREGVFEERLPRTLFLLI